MKAWLVSNWAPLVAVSVSAVSAVAAWQLLAVA